MSLKIDDSVRVKDAVMCPDNDSLCIGGWQGRVFEIEDVVGLPIAEVICSSVDIERVKLM